MFLVDARQRRTRQPDAYCRPNPAWALRILISGRDLVDVANDAQGTFAGGGQTLPTRGLHHAIFDGVDDSVSFPSNPRYNIGALTLVWVGYVADYANFNILVARAAGNGGLYNPFELRVDQTTGKLRLTRADGSGHATWVTGSAVGTGLLSVALTHVPAGAVPELVINGSRVAMSHDFGVLSTGATNTEPLYLGRRADGNYHKGGTALLGAIERLSSLAEITALSTNPWQLYADRRIWVPVSASGSDVSLAISGAVATSATGNTSAGISTALTGVSSTAATGTLATATSVALSGISSTAATGTLATATSVALSGISSTSAAGTLAASISAALTGASATAATGTLTAGGDATAAVTGQAASTAQGTLGVTVSGAAALSGASVAASAGTLSAGISTALTGASAAVSTGSLVAGGDVSVTIAGQAVSTAQGTVGVTATGAATVALTGAAAVIAAGNIFVVAPAVGWTPVDDSDPNAWIPVDDSNAALWV